MTLQEYLMIAQTVILFLTGLIVLWYTRVTHKIMKETKEQNSLINQQLLLTRETKDEEFKKQMSLYEPVFNYTMGGGDGNNKTTFKFRNDGKQIKEIKITPEEKYSISIYPKNILNEREEGTIEIYRQETQKDLLHFKIGYINKLGMEKNQKFQCSLSKRIFYQVMEDN